MDKKYFYIDCKEGYLVEHKYIIKETVMHWFTRYFIVGERSGDRGVYYFPPNIAHVDKKTNKVVILNEQTNCEVTNNVSQDLISLMPSAIAIYADCNKVLNLLNNIHFSEYTKERHRALKDNTGSQTVSKSESEVLKDIIDLRNSENESSVLIPLKQIWKNSDKSSLRSGRGLYYKAHTEDVEERRGLCIALNACYGDVTSSNVPIHPYEPSKRFVSSYPFNNLSPIGVSKDVETSAGAASGITLALAKTLRDMLLENKYDVLMLRSENSANLDEVAKAVMASNVADIYLSFAFDEDEAEDRGMYCITPTARNRKYSPCEETYADSASLMIQIESKLKEGYHVTGVDSDKAITRDEYQIAYSSIPNVIVVLGNVANASASDVNNQARLIYEGIEGFFSKNDDYISPNRLKRLVTTTFALPYLEDDMGECANHKPYDLQWKGEKGGATSIDTLPTCIEELTENELTVIEMAKEVMYSMLMGMKATLPKNYACGIESKKKNNGLAGGAWVENGWNKSAGVGNGPWYSQTGQYNKWTISGVKIGTEIEDDIRCDCSSFVCNVIYRLGLSNWPHGGKEDSTSYMLSNIQLLKDSSIFEVYSRDNGEWKNEDLRPGDIILRDGHTGIFAGHTDKGEILCYDWGGTPTVQNAIDENTEEMFSYTKAIHDANKKGRQFYSTDQDKIKNGVIVNREKYLIRYNPNKHKER